MCAMCRRCELVLTVLIFFEYLESAADARSVLLHSLNTKSVANEAIVFPGSDYDDDDDTAVMAPLKPSGRPSCPNGTTLCENVEGYPKELVERLLKYPSPLHDLFGIDDGPEETANQAIVFPDSHEDYDNAVEITPLKSHERPFCAKGGVTYCEETEGYPKGLVEKSLKYPSPLDDFFGIDDGPDETSGRFGNDTEVALCESFDKIIFPTYGKTKSSEWKYIVNEDGSERYVQGIRVKICVSPGERCPLLHCKPGGYTSFCKQEYTYRRLITISEDGQTTTDMFELPSACCCFYKSSPLDGLSFT